MSDDVITAWFAVWALSVLAFIAGCVLVLTAGTYPTAWAPPLLIAGGGVDIVSGVVALVVLIRA